MSTSASEKQRQAALERKRSEMMAEYAAQRATISNANNNADPTSEARFVKVTEGMEDRLKKSTVGLVHAEDFKRLREELEEENRRKAARTNELKEDALQQTKKRKKNKLAKDRLKTLSFGDEEQEEAETDDAAAIADAKRAKFGKNPTVDTSFLPDREREEKERLVREELRQQYLKDQEELKKQDIDIVCSYWDGSGHRTVVTCKKGDTIAGFLEKARAEFNELRQTSVDNLMYIKEDLIIPHHYTFYDFIVSKARGKSGPLFNFDAHDDVRLTHDATKEKNESHAGKIVERGWYNRNKHVFPSSRWEMFDPEKKYGNYSISDKSKQDKA